MHNSTSADRSASISTTSTLTILPEPRLYFIGVLLATGMYASESNEAAQMEGYALSSIVRLDLGVAIHAPFDTGRVGYYNIPKFWRDGLRLNFGIGYPF